MSSSQELYNRLSEKLRALVPVKNRKQVTNWIWIIVGILQSQSSHLSQIANTLPMATHALEHTRLQHAQRIDHLLLAMTIATLWCHELGEFVLKQGEPARCLVDPAHERTLSLFQLGLRWLKRILATGLHFLPDFQALLSNLKLKPVAFPVTRNPNV